MAEIKHITPRHYAFYVDEMMGRLKSEREIDVEHVLIMTDETDPGWL